MAPAGLRVNDAHDVLTQANSSGHVPGRFTIQDLLRAYADRLAAALDAASDHRAAGSRSTF